MKIIKKASYMLILFLPITAFGFLVTVCNKSNHNYQFTIWTYPVNFDALCGRENIDPIVLPAAKHAFDIIQTPQNTPSTLEPIPRDANLNIYVTAVSFDSPKLVQTVKKKSALIFKEIIKIDQGLGFKIPDINIYIDEDDNLFITTSTLIVL